MSATLPATEPPRIIEFQATTPLARPGWRYTARPQWSSIGESLWMRLSKFSLCNRLGVCELTELFSLRDDDGSAYDAIDLRRIGRWNQAALASILEISIADVQASFCSNLPRQLLVHSCTELRYCEPCLTSGFHAAWFQWLHVERCPLHNKPLRTACFHCSAPIPYVLGADLALSPLRCTGCLRDWVPSLSRPAGRCAALNPLAGQLMRRWSDYVHHVVGVDHLVYRHPNTGQFVAKRSTAPKAAPSRPHVLTMMNRLFESPPPVLGPAARPTASQLQPVCTLLTDRVPAHERDVRFDRQHWPHFANDFIRYERMVLAAQRYLFGPDGANLTGGQQRHLLLDGLVAPTTSMRRDAAAAVGWAVSWLGPSQALAPPTGFTAPAAGLTAWLARLPLRSHLISVRAWREQIARWLAEDLAHSARLWSHVSEFMSTKGHYLLYGEVVSPLSLAIRRETAQA